MEPELIQKLLRRIGQRDQEAFKVLFSHYYPKLIHISLAFVPGVVAAQEVISDVFYKLLKNPDVLQKVKNFDYYIYRTVRNQSYTYLKKNRDRNLSETWDHREDYFITDNKNPENSLISNELYRLVNDTVQNLPPKRKAVFLLVKEEGKKYREVADILGISIKTVELQMSIALKKLREVINDYQESKDVKVKKIDGNNLLNLFFSVCL